MLRSDPVQPGRISKHALRSMQRILAQPQRETRRHSLGALKSTAFAARLGKNAVGLEECRASFEASLCEAPQDEAFS